MKMTIVATIALPVILTFGMVQPAHAEIRLATPDDMRAYEKLIATADVVHLDGAVKVERKTSGYSLLWNSVKLLPVKDKPGTYGMIKVVGGKNTSNERLRIVALVPLYEYRGVQFPDREIKSVTVNGKPVKCFLFKPGKGVRNAIQRAQAAFANNRLFTSQIDHRTPTLFINAGTIHPGKKLRIEYELKPISGIRVNRRR